MDQNRRPLSHIYFFAIIAAIGGVLFGYSTSVISGALLFLKESFHLSTFQEGLVVSTLLVGALFGAVVGGGIADFIGRKKTLFITVFLYILGGLILVLSSSVFILLLGRLITGIATGIVSMVSPLYIAEISPAEKRGSLVSLNLLGITVGILLSFFVPYIYSVNGEWRSMFAFILILASIQFIGLFFIPETQSWLESKERGEIKKGSLSKNLIYPLIIGVGVASFQALTGINTVFYYAPQILKMAGFPSNETALFATVFIGLLNMILTALSLWYVDRVGRKTLLNVGFLGMGISFFILGAAFIFDHNLLKVLSILSMLLYVGFFAASLGPVSWMIVSEIYPVDVRGKAMGISICANWICNYFISFSFLSMVEKIGPTFAFWFYAIICIIGVIFAIKLVPETKGKTFEEIQRFWEKK